MQENVKRFTRTGTRHGHADGVTPLHLVSFDGHFNRAPEQVGEVAFGEWLLVNRINNLLQHVSQ